VLKEVGITHKGTSKNIDELPTRDFDLVITVCDSAADECPVWPGRAGRRVQRSFLDPAKTQGTDAVRLAVFRQVRDEILEEVSRLLDD
jgi:arsenate reductase